MKQDKIFQDTLPEDRDTKIQTFLVFIKRSSQA